MAVGPSILPSETARVLAACDGLLREIGRRQHRFSWLRDPAAPDDEWLVVDGYYPSNKLIVYCGEDSDELDLYRELVPQHGLYLLTIDPEDLPEDPIAAGTFIKSRLEQDGWSPRPSPKPVVAVPAPARQPQPQPTKVARAPSHVGAGTGVLVGLLLIVIVLAEAYLGLIVAAIDHGNPLLGAGLLADAATRTLGTFTAGQGGQSERTWTSLLIGSPAVAGHEQPAKLVAIAALVLLAAGIVAAIV